MTTDNTDIHLNLPKRIHCKATSEYYLKTLFSSHEALRREPKLPVLEVRQLTPRPTSQSQAISYNPQTETFKVNWELLKEDCFTVPNLKWKKVGDWKYSAYDLSGTCSCGKPYYEHLEFVKKNEELKLSVLKSMRNESDEILNQKPTALRKPMFFDKMMELYDNMKIYRLKW